MQQNRAPGDWQFGKFSSDFSVFQTIFDGLSGVPTKGWAGRSMDGPKKKNIYQIININSVKVIEVIEVIEVSSTYLAQFV